jgi:excisionase family DNA binding protein
MEWKSKREAAELLGLSTRGVERAVRRGHLTVLYRDSKHGKQAWFRGPELERYKQIHEARGPVGFTSGIPGQPPGPTIGTLIPMVEMEPRRRKRGGREAEPVPIGERLTLGVADAVQLSGLPRSFIVENIRRGKLKAIKIGRQHYVKRSDLNQFVEELDAGGNCRPQTGVFE